MSILVNASSKIVVQGAAGIEGQFHMKGMLDFGTKVVAGVDPAFKEATVLGIPAYSSLAEAVCKHQPDTSIIFVPAPYAYDAVMDAINHQIKLIIIITEGIPVHDMIKIKEYVRGRDIRIIGPNCPGLITAGECKVGIMPGHIHQKGSIGVISRSGTLTYEVVQALSDAGMGQTTCIGIGGDPIQGSNFVDMLRLFKDDEETKAVVIIGEIGGCEEEKAADFVARELGKPAVAFIAGKTAPAEKRMGHAGAIISGGKGTADAKIEALSKAGIAVAAIPSEIPALLKKALQ